MKRLGVNIDHVATIRNARGEGHPNINNAAIFAINSGADSITVHLREDRRHINDKDLKILLSKKKIPINLEIGSSLNMLKIALRHKPKFVCIVPERRKEITTEGGLNLNKNINKIKKIVSTLKKNKIRTSLFIDPSLNSIKIAKQIKTDCVELHTGKISKIIKAKKNYKKELIKIKNCSNYAESLNIEVHAGHGLDYKSTKILSSIKQIKEFNIGHFIIGESVFFGLKNVIRKFKKIIKLWKF